MLYPFLERQTQLSKIIDLGFYKPWWNQAGRAYYSLSERGQRALRLPCACVTSKMRTEIVLSLLPSFFSFLPPFCQGLPRFFLIGRRGCVFFQAYYLLRREMKPCAVRSVRRFHLPPAWALSLERLGKSKTKPLRGLRAFAEQSWLPSGEHSVLTLAGLPVALSLGAAPLLFGTWSSVLFDSYGLSRSSSVELSNSSRREQCGGERESDALGWET